MENNNCANCKHIKFINSEVSPGGHMFVTNYKCSNPESLKFDTIKNTITNVGRTIDSRKDETCENHSANIKKESNEPLLYKVIGTDNFDRDYISDILIKDKLILEEAYKIADDHNLNMREDGLWIYKVVEMSHELYNAYKDLP